MIMAIFAILRSDRRGTGWGKKGMVSADYTHRRWKSSSLTSKRNCSIKPLNASTIPSLDDDAMRRVERQGKREVFLHLSSILCLFASQ
jgi:hypothetical protein